MSRSPAAALFISGTDTGVGKTCVTAALAAYVQTYCSDRRLALFKPVQSGVGDREWYLQHFALTQTLDQITPLYFEQPVAPPIAAAAENRFVDLSLLWTAFQDLQLSYDQILVEGAGGLGSPVTAELTVADLARDWRLPTVLVVPVRLGALGQAIAHAALARESRTSLCGMILSCTEASAAENLEQWAPPALLESMTRLPVLGTLPFVADLSDIAALANIAASWHLDALLSPLYVPSARAAHRCQQSLVVM